MRKSDVVRNSVETAPRNGVSNQKTAMMRQNAASSRPMKK